MTASSIDAGGLVLGGDLGGTSTRILVTDLDGHAVGQGRAGGGNPTAHPATARDELVVALQEGWRGEIAHVLVTDDRGGVRRHKVVDPSFHNWSALALALPGNQISDFPLCNKSFNLSYAGHDL